MAVKLKSHGALYGAYIPHDPVVQDIGGPSLTFQEFAQDCDINEIMRRFEKAGDFGPNGMPLRSGEPQYLDLTWMPSNLQDTLAFLADAEEAFMTLPAVVRREMDNDPEKFCMFAADPANLPKMREWGLAPPAPPPPAPPAGASGAAGGGPGAPGSPPAPKAA